MDNFVFFLGFSLPQMRLTYLFFFGSLFNSCESIEYDQISCLALQELLEVTLSDKDFIFEIASTKLSHKHFIDIIRSSFLNHNVVILSLPLCRNLNNTTSLQLLLSSELVVITKK